MYCVKKRGFLLEKCSVLLPIIYPDWVVDSFLFPSHLGNISGHRKWSKGLRKETETYFRGKKVKLWATLWWLVYWDLHRISWVGFMRDFSGPEWISEEHCLHKVKQTKESREHDYKTLHVLSSSSETTLQSGEGDPLSHKRAIAVLVGITGDNTEKVGRDLKPQKKKNGSIKCGRKKNTGRQQTKTHN